METWIAHIEMMNEIVKCSALGIILLVLIMRVSAFISQKYAMEPTTVQQVKMRTTMFVQLDGPVVSSQKPDIHLVNCAIMLKIAPMGKTKSIVSTSKKTQTATILTQAMNPPLNQMLEGALGSQVIFQ